jgi:hypothetical protein
MPTNMALRARIATTVSQALQPHSSVLAGWEGGSAAFEQVDAYSDVDLTFLVANDASFEALYLVAEKALATISPIELSHSLAIGRYYKLRDCDEFLLLDLVFLRVGEPDHFVEPERHGHITPLFDKEHWLEPDGENLKRLDAKREERYRDLRLWFSLSQTFVRKAIWRKRPIEAIASFGSYTIRPLVELLRMRHCPARWDFGMRYLERDLPPVVYDELLKLILVHDCGELEAKLVAAEYWANRLFSELSSIDDQDDKVR